MGRNWQVVWFSDKHVREDCFNKRAEMYVLCHEWLKEGGAIDDDQQLADEMLAIDTIPMIDGKYKMPPKEDIKEILGCSPNRIDQLALTFAYPVLPKSREITGSLSQKTRVYDPYANIR